MATETTAHDPIDWAAIELVILQELQRQGIEFGKVTVRPNYPGEMHLIVETWRESQLNPKYVEAARVSSAITRVNGRKQALDEKTQ